jgi:mRNA-degrading endonuclease RelE of RelBE toxin-antitoxin system
MPASDRTRINQALNAMKLDPFSGDTIPLKGEFQGSHRRRVGSWRIIFRARAEEHVLLIADIVRRTSTTY